MTFLPRLIRALNPRVSILTVLFLLVVSAILVVEGGRPPDQLPGDVPRGLAADQMFYGTPDGRVGSQTVAESWNVRRAAKIPKARRGVASRRGSEAAETAQPAALPAGAASR